MKISLKGYSSLGLLVVTLTIIGCGRSATSNEKTTFTRIDSVTDTYLSLQDTLLHSWNVLIKDEHEKIKAVDEAILHLMKLPLSDVSQLTSLGSRLEQLKQISITQKTLSNPYVVEEYDFASNSLISEILTLSETTPALLQNNDFHQLIDKIKLADQRTSGYRLEYDSIADQFNAFLEKNKSLLKDIDNGSLEKRPMFSVATNR
jgi:methyl-accepting chemotaxis protein